MSNVNSVTISGRTGKQPEIRYTASGTGITIFAVAVNGYSKEGDPPTYWIDCKCFGKLAEVVASRVPKGGRVIVQGELVQERWQTPEGANRSKVIINARQIDIMDWTDDGQAPSRPQPDTNAAPAKQAYQPPAEPVQAGPVQAGTAGYEPKPIEFDDIPF